jgi:hypothetical protein
MTGFFVLMALDDKWGQTPFQEKGVGVQLWPRFREMGSDPNQLSGRSESAAAASVSGGGTTSGSLAASSSLRSISPARAR